MRRADRDEPRTRFCRGPSIPGEEVVGAAPDDTTQPTKENVNVGWRFYAGSLTPGEEIATQEHLGHFTPRESKCTCSGDHAVALGIGRTDQSGPRG